MSSVLTPVAHASVIVWVVSVLAVCGLSVVTLLRR